MSAIFLPTAAVIGKIPVGNTEVIKVPYSANNVFRQLQLGPGPSNLISRDITNSTEANTEHLH